MPGRTPSDAFRTFIDPIQEAASCLGQVKLTVSPGGQSAPGVTHAWSLNAERGQVFRGGWHFEAQMHYEFEQGAFSREWKVRTRGYRYQLALRGTHLWRLHWHPTTNSSYDLPHVHLNLGRPGELVEPSLNKHHPTGRMTFEDAVEWVFNAEIPPARDDWREVLDASRAQHLQHRSWHHVPPVEG